MNTNEHPAVMCISTNVLFSNKPVLTAKECAAYIGISKKYLYQLTSKNQVPFFKPRGKMLYFKRCEIDLWLTSRGN